jgi:hypothetical protein
LVFAACRATGLTSVTRHEAGEEDKKVADAHGPSGDGEAQGHHIDGNADDSLEGAARGEREYARERLNEQLGREPTEDEVNEWLRAQTEGY